MKKSLYLLLAISIALVWVGCEASQNVIEAPYEDTLANAQVFIDVPNLRQYGGYTCGTTCVQMLMNWVYPYAGDLNLVAYEELLGTSDEGGTPPENIVAYFREQGVQVEEHSNFTIEALIQALEAGHPLMLPLQAWSTAEDGSFNTTDPEDAETYLIEGHWVICVGYDRTEAGYRFYFNDPACVGYCYLEGEELDSRWVDMDYAGTLFDHYGIEILSPSGYVPQGVFHMD